MTEGLISQDYLGNSLLFGSSGGGQWAHDWTAYQTLYDLTGTTVSVGASAWQTFLDITGKGVFKWVRMNTGTAGAVNPAIRLTIDGQAYSFDSPLAGSGNQGNEVNFEIPFKSSLKIEGFNRSAGAAALYCDYLYLLQQSSPNPSKITLLQQSQRKAAYYSAATTTLADVVNITGSGYLLGVRFLSFYNSANAIVNGDIIVDGVQKMTDRTLVGVGTPSNRLTEVVGPIRFNSSLRIRIRTDIAGATPICFVWYSLD